MNCPACKAAMIVLELDEVEVDYCTECEGIWLDCGELELLLADTSKAEALLSSFQEVASPEKRRKCPICLRKMNKVLVGGRGDTQELIDCCGHNHGLWFDRGELQNILKMGDFDDEGRIQDLLGDLFCPEPKCPEQ